MQNRKAFSMLEIIILAILLFLLSMISFFSFHGYTVEARDSKRLADIRSLLNVITIEDVKGAQLEELIQTNPKINQLTLNGETKPEYKSYQGKVNFDVLSEEEDFYKDPVTGDDYPFAFSKGKLELNGNMPVYKFMQVATINEKNRIARVFGNYYQISVGEDSPGLITGTGGESFSFVEDKGMILPYCLNGSASQIQIPIENQEIGCAPRPFDSENAMFTEGSPTMVNQLWQNNDSNAACYFNCKRGYLLGENECIIIQ